MKKQYLAMVIALTFIVFGCKKDDDELPETGEPIELSGTQDVPLVLENRFDNPNAPDYIVSGTWHVDAAVTVEPGVRVEMTSGARINVRSSGSFKAVGTAVLPIYFEGASPSKGFWDYIRFDNSNNPDNQLIYTIIRHGGGSSLSSGNASVFLNGNAQAKIQHTTVSHSARAGIRLRSTDGRLPEFQQNTIDECELHPIVLAGLRQINEFDGSNNFVGNNNFNLIYVENSTVQTQLTVKDVNGPINLNGTTHIEAAVKVEPGADFRMGPGARINVRNTGSLNMIGTSANQIIVNGEAEAKGYWDYIRFDDSNNPLNEFQFVDISNGGGSSLSQGDASVFVNNSGYLKMGNSTISNSQRFGLRVRSNDGTFVDDGNNNFFGNELGDVELP